MITTTIALYIFGVSLVPAIGFCIWVATMLSAIRREHSTEVKALMKDVVRAVNTMTYYVKWAIENNSGQAPPPPTESL